MADNLEQMKQKYASVLAAVEQQQVRLSHVHMQDNKLFIQGVAPSEQAKNRVWDQIKLVNPNWQQELTADITVDPSSASANEPVRAQAAGSTHSMTTCASSKPTGRPSATRTRSNPDRP
jgi:hypothetical protein